MISIICPIYNTSKYLNKCIDSIYKQSFNNWELLLINDCSSDNSHLIIDKWVKKDNRIKAINHKMNKGVDQARFTGINNSQGEYIMFVDSDDWIDHNALENLFEKIEEEKSDIVFGSIIRVIDRWGIIKSKPKNNYSNTLLQKSIELPQLFDDYYISYFGKNKLFVSMWGKLYRKKAIIDANLKPTNYKMGEDLLFNVYLHPFLTKISFIKDTVYYYRYGGMTSKTNPSLLTDLKSQYHIKKRLINKYSYNKALPYINYELINIFYSYIKSLFLISKSSFEYVEQFVIEELKDNTYNECLKNIKLKEKHIFIKNKNKNAIITYAKSKSDNEIFKYQIKKIISYFLN